MNRWAINLAIIVAAFGVPAALADILDETDLVVGHYHSSPLTNSLTADVVLSNTSNFFDGPTVAQGNVGTWFVSGTVTLEDVSGGSEAQYYVELWDGHAAIASAVGTQSIASTNTAIALSGYISNPAGNLRLSAKDITSTSGAIRFNQSGNLHDSTITAYRIR